MRTDGKDVLEFLPGCVELGGIFHTMVGRPFPLIVDDQLYNIYFNARPTGDRRDDIWAWTSTPPLGDAFLTALEQGHMPGWP